MLFKNHATALAVLFLVTQQVCCDTNTSSATPIGFSPSWDWDGIDGTWSTFTVQIGTPPQAVRLLPSTTGNTIWAVLPQACRNSSVETCVSDRGGLFSANESSTWEDEGLFQLPLNPQHYLPFSGAANFGFETVTLGWQGYDNITLDHQVVAGYLTEDFYVGALGLSPLSINITSYNDQYPSLLGTLKAENRIPSTAYGYTAGAFYHSHPKRATGSLTLGGFDSTRMDSSKNLTVIGGSDMYRPMLLGIEEIKSDSTDLLEAPVIAALDSIVSQIWLPISACRRFESAFGIVWDSKHELYIVNDTQHSILVEQNSNITFILSTGSERHKSDLLEINLPYAAFDLTAKPPFAGLNETVHYFPLKQAVNSTQYTLGRVFFQEAYIIAEDERAAVSVFPAVFPDFSIEPRLVSIISVEEIITPTHSQDGLPRAAMAGIIVGGIMLSVLVAAGISSYVYCRRQKNMRKPAPGVTDPRDKAELAANESSHEDGLEAHVAGNINPESVFPLETSHEIASSPDPRDFRSSQINSASLSPQEMPGDHVLAELCNDGQIHEVS